jgi:hypothetical protein
VQPAPPGQVPGHWQALHVPLPPPASAQPVSHVYGLLGVALHSGSGGGGGGGDGGGDGGLGAGSQHVHKSPPGQVPGHWQFLHDPSPPPASAQPVSHVYVFPGIAWHSGSLVGIHDFMLLFVVVVRLDRVMGVRATPTLSLFSERSFLDLRGVFESAVAPATATTVRTRQVKPCIVREGCTWGQVNRKGQRNRWCRDKQEQKVRTGPQSLLASV